MGTGVEIVIVTHRPPDGLLERAVRSVVEANEVGGVEVRLTVVDNGGGAADSLAGVDLVEFGITIDPQPNDGFGATANAGITAGLERDADVVVVLNDDVAVEPEWLSALLAEFDDPEVGAAQPLLLAGAGETVDSAGVRLDRFGAGSDLGRGKPVEEFGEKPSDLAVFTGGAVALRREFLADVGMFDERFFLYYEDVELARRGARRGWRYRLVPASRVLHAGSATTSTMGDHIVWMRERNRLWSAAMTGSRSEFAAALWLSVRRVRHHPRRVHIRGLTAGLAGVPTRWVERLRRR